MGIWQRLRLALCILFPFFGQRQKAYRVVWFRPDWAYVEKEAGTFFAKDDAEAKLHFEENYEKNQRHNGDALILYRVVVQEQVQIVATVDAKEIIGDE